MCKLNHKFLLASLFAIIVPVMTQSVEDSAHAAPSVSQFSASAEYNRALSLERGKKWQSAILILEKCVRYCPGMADAWLELGQCYLAVKDFSKAEKVLLAAQRKVSTESAQKRVMKALIHCYGMSGQLESLEMVRKQYLTCFPHEADSAVIREQIEYYDKDFARTRNLSPPKPTT